MTRKSNHQHSVQLGRFKVYYNNPDDMINNLSRKLEKNEQRLNYKFNEYNRAILGIEKNMTNLEINLKSVKKKIGNIDSKLNTIIKRLR